MDERASRLPGTGERRSRPETDPETAVQLKWDNQLLVNYLWQLGKQCLASGEKNGEAMLAIWDESVVEKSESSQLERLGPVRSSKAVRLKRISPDTSIHLVDARSFCPVFTGCKC